jgi:hypothetical protein
MKRYYFKSDKGKEYGPISANDIRNWQRQKRMNSESLVRYEDSENWQPLSSFSELSSNQTSQQLLSEAGITLDSNNESPATQATQAQQQNDQNFQPHRGGMILAFGILGLCCCFPFGIAAWVMGHADMKLINSGVMDPTGRGMTDGGKICGIISVIINSLYWGLNLLPALYELSQM